MSDLRFLACDKTGALVDRPLPIGDRGSTCSLRLGAVAGASAILVVVRDDERVHLRAEVACEGGESVSLRLEHDPDGHVHVTSPGRRVLTLPGRRADDPLPLPLRVSGPPGRLDLAIVVDGTTRQHEKQKGSLAPLLADPQAWALHVEALRAFVEALAEQYATLRVAVMAFGDVPLPLVRAANLKPAYHLSPKTASERALRAQPVAEVTAALAALQPTSGGDFVDALADALDACTRLRWEDGRKLVLVTGDSPGHSLLFPGPSQANAGLRRRDVDVEAARLFERGVEVVTVYHDLARDSGFYDIAQSRELLDFARRQYLRLASRPEMAFTASRFDPAAAAEAVVQGPPLLGRGACLGVMME